MSTLTGEDFLARFVTPWAGARLVPTPVRIRRVVVAIASRVAAVGSAGRRQVAILEARFQVADFFGVAGAD